MGSTLYCDYVKLSGEKCATKASVNVFGNNAVFSCAKHADALRKRSAKPGKTIKKIEVTLYLEDDANMHDVLNKLDGFKKELFRSMQDETHPRLVDTVHENFGEAVETYYHSKFQVSTIEVPA